MPHRNKLKVIVTRKLPDIIETRLMELFDCQLNLDDHRMTHDELRAAWKAQLKAGPDEFSKGAGIGFIEIARRASEPLDFDFSEVDDDHVFFALRARV